RKIRASKPDFSKVVLFDDRSNVQAEEASQLSFETNEQIDVKPLYTNKDLEGMEHLDDKPGLAPFTRGPYPTMYVNRPWT
ncbi:methylmalonyl-CoA mutase, partial [Pseudomonas sp. MPR-R5A]